MSDKSETTTEEVRKRYTTGAPGSALSRSSEARREAGGRFDRWLETVSDDALRPAAEQVRAAWLNAGTHPEYHERQKAELLANWPTLYWAVTRLAELPTTTRPPQT